MPGDFEKEPFCYNEPECLPEPQPQPVNPGLPVDVGTPEKKKEETVSIYKAPQKGDTDRAFREGYTLVEIQGNPLLSENINPNGRCYFAGPTSKSVAEDYANMGTYDPYVIEFVFDKEWYEKYMGNFERPYFGRIGKTELVVPNYFLSTMNLNTLKPIKHQLRH